MIRVVLDTNIIVSAALRADGNEAAVLDWVAHGHAQMGTTPAILIEYADVLARPKFRLDQQKVRAFLAAIYDFAIVVKPGVTVTAAKDEPDNRFIECAETLAAEFLVTGNRRHFPPRWKTTRIVSSRELLAAVH